MTSYRYTKIVESTFERAFMDKTGALKKNISQTSYILSQELEVNQIQVSITRSKLDNKKTCFVCQEQRTDINGLLVDKNK